MGGEARHCYVGIVVVVVFVFFGIVALHFWPERATFSLSHESIRLRLFRMYVGVLFVIVAVVCVRGFWGFGCAIFILLYSSTVTVVVGAITLMSLVSLFPLLL